MNVTLLAPHWLWLLLLVPALFRVRSRTSAPVSPWPRALVVALLVVGLARPTVVTEDPREVPVVVLDASESVAPDRLRAACAVLRDSRDRAPSTAVPSFVVIGDSHRIELSELAASGALLDDRASLRDGSSLATGLEVALERIPSGSPGSITLVTDGRATDARYGDALLACQTGGIPVHVVALPTASATARVAAIVARRSLRVGRSDELEVEVVGAGGDVRVELFANGAPIRVVDVAIDAIDERGFGVVEFEPKEAGFVAIEARCGATTSTFTLAVQDPIRALYLGQRVEGGAAALTGLVGPGVRIEQFLPNDGDVAATPSLDRFDLVVLDDMPADALPAATTRAIVEGVTSRGLGLFACGGEAAFGAGGWKESEIGRILPVDARQKEEKRDPSTTLVVIIDTSGSMGGERIQLAKEVARLAMSRLLPHDKVGIVEFYGAKRWAAPIQPASNTIDLSRAINRMDAGGGTIILPAIEEAFYGMQNVQTRYKHVLVLTDGGVESGSFEPLLRRMAEEGINVSTVLIGPEAHSEFLVDLANWGKGRFYAVPDRFNLPEVLLKQPTSSRLPAYQRGTFVLDVRGGRGWWGDIDRDAFASVAGYAETESRSGAETLLEIRGQKAPLLATWRYGLGRVTAFMTEPTGPGTAPWRGQPEYGRFLARVLERTANDGARDFDFALVRRGAELEIEARRRVPEPLRPTARIVDLVLESAVTESNGTGGSDRGREEARDVVSFEERAPGLFVARVPFAPDEPARILAGTEGTSRPEAAAWRLAADPRSDEREESAVSAAGAIDLARVALATGGDLVDLADLAGFLPRSSGGGGARRDFDLTPFLLALGLAAYVAEIWWRRRDRVREVVA